MRKKVLVAITTMVCLLSPFFVFGEETSAVALQSKSAILMEQETGEIIYEKDSHAVMPPASVTKVMTLLLIYEAEAAGKFEWTDTVQVSEHAAGMGGSQVYLEVGETQTAADMVKCIAIASANDAAVAMAEFIAGSEEAFVGKMNERAKQLGMNETNFVNACGLDTEGHVTSAYDIALMSRELMLHFPEIQQYTTTWQDSIEHTTNKGTTTFGLTNTNKLIKWYEGATGLKTGSTSQALYCLSATAEKDDLSLIAVVMAAPDYKIRFQEAMQLFDYGFANFAIEKGYEVGAEMARVAVEKGQSEEVRAVVKDEISVLVEKGGEVDWETKMELLPSVKAPILEGEKVGEMIYIVAGEEVGRTDLVSATTIEKITMQKMLARMIQNWC